MIQKIKLMSIAVALMLVTIGCKSKSLTQALLPSALESSNTSLGSLPNQSDSPDVQNTEYIPFAKRLEAMRGQNWTNLTTDQMLEDWDTFYKNLEENYPYFGVVARTTSMDMKAAYEEVRAQIPSYTSDMDFYITIYNYIEQTGKAGHLSLNWPEISNETGESYKSLYYLIIPVMKQAQAEYNSKEGLNEYEQNVITKIIEEGSIAYVKINSFDMGQYDADKITLMDFYKNIGDYDNLIIDITQNGGGGMAYYFDLILDPLLKEPVDHLFYTFLKDGSLNRARFQQNGGSIENNYPLTTTPADIATKLRTQWDGQVSQDDVNRMCTKVESLPWPPTEMNMDDFNDFDYYDFGIWSFNPEDKLFNGKVWVLVSGNVYSSSESFALFCKSTGFATLVGTQTGGDGIGTDPIIFRLPNSGIHVRYAPIYGTTLDGRSSEEFGTTPDIISLEGQSPLDTCLKAISESR